MSSPDGRCPAAHAEDPTPCDGPADAVTIRDQYGAEQGGCVNHGSAYLASIEHATVHPGSVDGAAIEMYRRAQTRRPFDFLFTAHEAPEQTADRTADA